jgi:hypothetical protein
LHRYIEAPTLSFSDSAKGLIDAVIHLVTQG